MKNSDKSDESAVPRAIPAVESSGNRQAVMAVADGILGAGLLIILGVWGGGMLDDRFHTSPWIAITLALICGALGLARLIAKANEIDSGKIKRSLKSLSDVSDEDDDD